MKTIETRHHWHTAVDLRLQLYTSASKFRTCKPQNHSVTIYLAKQCPGTEEQAKWRERPSEMAISVKAASCQKSPFSDTWLKLRHHLPCKVHLPFLSSPASLRPGLKISTFTDSSSEWTYFASRSSTASRTYNARYNVSTFPCAVRAQLTHTVRSWCVSSTSLVLILT